ncbi:MAG: hypothetical protein ACFFG0_02905 [Candidatus Thorarchaeota archaeon]
MDYIELIRQKDERIKNLKKENKLLKEKIETIFSRCYICGSRKVTKHSLTGKHKFPFVPLCREHHDLIEAIKESFRAIKGEKNSGLSVTRFKKMIKTFTL